MNNPLLNPNSPLSFLIPLLILVVVFLLCRELVCWYWKINRIVAALEKIADQPWRAAP